MQCKRCHRQLHSEQSIRRGYGKTCWSKARTAQVDAKPDTISKAIELIEDGGVVHLRSQVFRTVSTDGAETYLTAPTNCSCPAGRNGRVCYHTAAVQMLLAA